MDRTARFYTLQELPGLLLDLSEQLKQSDKIVIRDNELERGGPQNLSHRVTTPKKIECSSNPAPVRLHIPDEL